MSHLYARYIFHLDLKTGNVLLTDDLEPVVVDFVSQHLSPGETVQQSMVAGLSLYMALEIHQSECCDLP
jgi:serine/threonine protein kinase